MNGILIEVHLNCVVKLDYFVMDIHETISDNTVSTSTNDSIDIDEVISDLTTAHDNFLDKVVGMLCLRNKCSSLIEKLTLLKTNNVEPAEEIIEEVRIIMHAISHCHMYDHLKAMIDLINKLLYDEEWEID